MIGTCNQCGAVVLRFGGRCYACVGTPPQPGEDSMTTPPEPPPTAEPLNRYTAIYRAAITLERMRGYGVPAWIRTPVLALLAVAHDEPLGARLREALAAYQAATTSLARADALATLRGILEAVEGARAAGKGSPL